MPKHAPGRDAYFRYCELNSWKVNEFGSPIMRYAMLHRCGDVMVISHSGRRIIEIHPDDTCYLIAPQTLNCGIMSHWASLASHTRFSVQIRRRVSGLKEYMLTRYRTTTGPNEGISSATFTSRVKYNLDGTLTTEGVPQKMALQDRVKYRAFNKQIKQLRAVLFAQIKIHTHAPSMDTKDWQKRNKAREVIQGILNAHYGHSQLYGVETAYLLVHAWMDKQDPLIVKHIALYAFAMHYSEAKGIEDLLRRVGNMLKHVQQFYLQEHCVRITEEYLPSPANDQQSELQPLDGLREVSLSGQA